MRSEDGRHVFVKPLPPPPSRPPYCRGDVAVALFNETDAEAEIVATPAELGAGLGTASPRSAKDLWTGDRIEIGGGLGASVPAHGTAIYRVSAG